MGLLVRLRQLAENDQALLKRNARYGDHLEKPRVVTFELLSDGQERAEAASAFINECGYGEAFVSDDVGWSLTSEETPGWRVLVRMSISSTPSALKCSSGLMLVVAELHGLNYEGWGGELIVS